MAVSQQKNINLALQGGGSHGAFCWGVLDYILEDGRLDVEGISATSAGAANAVLLAQGLLNNDKEEAREVLEDFWRTVSQAGIPYQLFKPMTSMFTADPYEQFNLDDSALYLGFDFLSKILSPYQFNPLNMNPLKDLLSSKIDFEAIQKHSKLKIFLCATNVETGKIQIFPKEQMQVEAVLASACLPFLFQSVSIQEQFYWDGGYIGNPAIFPLIYDCASKDVVIVHINPIVREGEPKSAAEILNRLNEISFNSSLVREMRAISFVSKLIDDGTISEDKMKKMRLHSVRCDREMTKYSVSSKLNTDWTFLSHLKDQGRAVAASWLEQHFNQIGKQSSIDIQKEFL